MKTCSICGQLKELGDFYTHPRGADGYMTKCKACVLALRKSYAKTPSGIEAHKRACQQYEASHKEKRTAQRAVGNAIRDGRLAKQPCEICGSREVHAHHDDYKRPLEVRWLCPPHHVEHHNRERAK